MTLIREATLEDLNDIVIIEKACFPEFQQASRASLSRSIQSPNQTVLVAIEQRPYRTYTPLTRYDEVVGCIFITYRKNSDKAYFDSLAVLPDFRKQGIASDLKNYGIMLSYIRDKKELYSHVLVTNKKMVELNKRFDFKIVETCKNFYGPGKHAYKMVKL